MRRWWPSLLAVLVLYILVFHTPFFVTNLLIGTTTKLRSTFRDRHGNLLHYEASHRRLDGNLFAEMIRTGELQPKRIDRATTYPLIAMPKLPRHPTYSSFTTVCAHLVQTYLPKTPHKIGVFVSKRGGRAARLGGNLIVLATYETTPDLTMEEVQRRHHEAVKRAKQSSKSYMTIADMAEMLRCTYIFNSHRAIGKIVRHDGTVLRQVNVKPVKYRLSDLRDLRPALPMSVVFSHDGDRYTIYTLQTML